MYFKNDTEIARTLDATCHPMTLFSFLRHRLSQYPAYIYPFCYSFLAPSTRFLCVVCFNGKVTRNRASSEGLRVGCSRQIWSPLSVQILQEVTFFFFLCLIRNFGNVFRFQLGIWFIGKIKI